jgi:hypothetical protein
MNTDKRYVVEYFELLQVGNSTNSSTGATPLTPDQLYALQLTTKFTAAASMAGALIIIISYVFIPIFRRITSRLVLYLSISDFFASLGFFLGRWPLANGIGGFCYFQAVLIEQFGMSSAFWTVCIAINLFSLIYRRKTERQLARYEPFYHLAAWGLPVPMWVICLAVSEPNLGTPFGDASLWCWITVKWGIFQILFFYVPLWACFLFNLCVYILTGYKIFKEFRRLKDSKTPQGKKLDKKKKLSYMRSVSGYILAFFVTWVWGSINRAQNWANPLHPIFVLFLFHAIFTPLQGFLDFIVYAWATMWKRYSVIKRSQKDASSQQWKHNPSQGGSPVPSAKNNEDKTETTLKETTSGDSLNKEVSKKDTERDDSLNKEVNKKDSEREDSDHKEQNSDGDEKKSSDKDEDKSSDDSVNSSSNREESKNGL